jgi:hypothetical protein
MPKLIIGIMIGVAVLGFFIVEHILYKLFGPPWGTVLDPVIDLIIYWIQLGLWRLDHNVVISCVEVFVTVRTADSAVLSLGLYL